MKKPKTKIRMKKKYYGKPLYLNYESLSVPSVFNMNVLMSNSRHIHRDAWTLINIKENIRVIYSAFAGILWSETLEILLIFM